MNQQTTQLRATVTDLQNQIKAVTAERDQLKAQTAGAAGANAAEVELLQAHIQTLSSEKAALEKTLADTNAKLTGQPSEDTAALVSFVILSMYWSLSDLNLKAVLRQERDQLLAEKETWTKTQNTPNGSPDAKLALQKSLEAALAKAKVCKQISST